MKTCFTYKKITAFLLVICMMLSMVPVYASAQETSLGTSEEIVDSGALPDTGSEPQDPPATPSDVPQSPLGRSGMGGTGPMAAATATARAVVGTYGIQIWLTGGTFAASGPGGLDHTKWTFSLPSGVSVGAISRISDYSVAFELSAMVTAEQAFSITGVDSSQFADGTEPFSTPLDVEVKTPAPAVGNATADAGTRDIFVALTSGEFHTNQNASHWQLGGDSASGNSITGATYIDISHVKITLANDIGATDQLTVTSAVNAFRDNGTQRFASPLPVTVSTPSASCAIGTKEYATLTEALANVKSGETIKLLGDITHTAPVEISGKVITFDLRSFNLLIDTSETERSTALWVKEGGNVGYNADDHTFGTLIVCGGESGYGVRAEEGSQVSVSGVLIKTHWTTGAYAVADDSKITVNGDIKTVGGAGDGYTWAIGAKAASGGKVEVYGKIDVQGSYACGAEASDVGEVTVTAAGTAISVTGSSVCGINPGSDTGNTITIQGDVTVEGSEITGVSGGGGEATINGNLTVNGTPCTGIDTRDSSHIKVNGNLTVTGANARGIDAHKGEGRGGKATVTGNLTVVGDANSVGICCSSEGTEEFPSVVTVDGTITAPIYLNLDGETRGAAPTDGTDGIYSVYTGQYDSVVKVGNSAGPSLPIVTTTLVSPAEITSTGARVRGGVTATGGTEITAFGFAWGLSADPTTDNATAAGAGTAASFWADLSGLVPSQTYYVRAYATNSAGTAYGENRTFTTAASDPLGAPLNLRYLAHDGAVELMWDAPSSASPIVRYELMRGNDLVNGTWEPIGDDTTHTVTGLTNGVNAYFNLRAVNADGPGQHAGLWAMANIPTVPGAPHSLVTSGGDGWVRISWQAPPYTGHRPITGYYVSTDGSVWSELVTDTSHQFTGLTNGVAYTFYVRAVNAVGPGEAASAQGTPRSTGGGSMGGNYTPAPTPIITDKQPDMPTTARQSVTGTVKDGVLSATITEQMVKDAIKAAQDAAKKSGKEVDGIALDFNVTGSGSYTSLNATIDAAAIDRLKEAGVRFIKIGSSILDITLDTAAITELDEQSSGAVTLSAIRQTKLSDVAKALIGNRPVFDITVSYQRNGKPEYVTNFGKGVVILGIAYQAQSGEKAGNLYGVYVDKNGRPQLLPSSSYDNGRLIFSRNSLSTYGVGYKTPAPAFTDTANHWAKDNIDFVASRGLITGTSATTFAPNAAITRADFLMALGRLSGADVSGFKTSSFTDVKATDPAMPYIEWAVKNKIVQGMGGGKFGLALSITRQDMAVMTQNYAKATGYTLPVSTQVVTFADSAKIAAYAKDAVKAIQQAGIMQGKGGNIFDPQGTATRGEAATILRRFVELVIDEGTARGWVQNDVGKWQYIGENGKPVTGWLNITGTDIQYYFDNSRTMVSGQWLQVSGKWYYFYADGALARSTEVGGYEVDEDGVRKSK